MRLTSSRAYTRPAPVPKMPLGLVELMDGMARDVLKNNPTNVYEFCADHMKKLLEIRDGPSLKKPLSLEQKILKAQEKVRQIAKERRKRFDNASKLLSNKSDEQSTAHKSDNLLIQEDLVVPNLKVPIHHDHDLEHASEVEISHVPHAEKSPLSEDASNGDEFNFIEELHEVTIENSAQPEKVNFELKTDDNLFFGKVEKEVMKELEIIKIVSQDEVTDSHLQTITEATDESTEGTTSLLPVITIGDERDVDASKNIAQESVNYIQLLNVVDNHEKQNSKSGDMITIKPNEIQNKSEELPKITDLNELDKKTATDADNNVSVFVNNHEKIFVNDQSTVPLADKEKHKINTETLQSAEIINESISTNTIEKDSDDSRVLNIVQSDKISDSSNAPSDIVHKSDSQDSLSPGDVTIHGGGLHEKDSKDEQKSDSQNPVKPADALNEGGVLNEKDSKKEQKSNSQNSVTPDDAPNDGGVLHENDSKNEKTTDSQSSVTPSDAPNDGGVLHEKDSKNEQKINSQNSVTPDNSPNDGRVLHEKDSEIEQKSDNQNSVTQADAPNDGEVLHEKDSKNEQTYKDTDRDEEQHRIINTSNENSLKATEKDSEESGSSTKTKDDREKNVDDKANVIEIHKSVFKIPVIDIDKSEPDKILLKVETLNNDQSLGNDAEKDHNDSTEMLLQKSGSTENTNEDSISMLESDLSKTDDDSTQNNTNNMDLETAAVTIQKVFRSLMFKSRNSTFEDTTNDENNSMDEDNDKKEEYYAAANLNKERRPLGITRMDTVLQTVNEEKSLSLSTDDSSTLSSAATTIQAHVRGFLVRNKLNSSKTFSMNSLVNSHEVFDSDFDQQKNKTVLNIHIVPEEGNYLSRDESFITSMDLSLDGSPPSSVNLHPLSYDTSERRKMLKREDAVQSVSPPSNNSGKLSEDSVKEMSINENGVLEREQTDDKTNEIEDQFKDVDNEVSEVISSASTVTPTTIITISKSEEPLRSPREYPETALQRSLTKMSSDESDVITPFVPSPRSSENATSLLHSGEFHDVVLPTKVSRNDTSVVRGQ